MANLRSIPHRQSGFTLAELAIVTVIIGFLLALFMPATTALVEQQKRKVLTLVEN